MSKSYKLCRELFGHTGDVRGLAVAADGSIVSASRDKTAILWKFQDGNYVGNITMTGHSNFVCSVCFIPPSQSHPLGLIITGSNDNHLCIYNVGETQPLHKVKAHENAVCCLATCRSNPTNAFLSSSWDVTAKLWNLDDLDKPRMTLVGHSAAVWCVADLPNGAVITGSADKLVIVHSANDGKALHKLEGHSDCVRGIAVIREVEFLTCANDATIKHWSALTGDCLGNYFGHSNYIYGVAATNEGALAVSSGEDRTVRVWRNGEVEQTIELPAQSIWCVQLLGGSEDVVCGASDGLVRVFSRAEERWADEETRRKFEEQVEAARASCGQQIGDLNTDKIPGPEALLQPGKSDGQTRLIKEDNRIKAYGWSQNELKWNLIGDVTGGNSDSSGGGGRMHNGAEYDYVFNIDIQDGVPPLKLPYNRGDDPWHAAQNFIDKNNLSQYYLEQIANFIIKNSTPAPTIDTSGVNNANQFYDPFTGGNRYIPSGGDGQAAQPGNNNSTAAAAAVVANSNATVTSSADVTSYIPMKVHLRIEHANLSAIKAKIQEFNAKPEVQSIPEDMLDTLMNLCSKSNEDAVAAGMVDILASLMAWPDTSVFPVLDAARLAVLHKNVNERLCKDALMDLLIRHLSKEAVVANQMLTYRFFANMMCHEVGERVCLGRTSDILTALQLMPNLGMKNNQVAVATYLLNLAVSLNRLPPSDNSTTTTTIGSSTSSSTNLKSQLLRTVCTILTLFPESEATFRVLVAVGTLLHEAGTTTSDERAELVRIARESENMLGVLQDVAEEGEEEESASDSGVIPSGESDKLVVTAKAIIDLIV